MGKLGKRSLCVLFNRYVINNKREIIKLRILKVYSICGIRIEWRKCLYRFGGYLVF